MKEDCKKLGQGYFDLYDEVQGAFGIIKRYSTLEFGKFTLDEVAAKMAHQGLVDALVEAKKLRTPSTVDAKIRKVDEQIQERLAPLTMEQDFLEIMEQVRDTMLEEVTQCECGK